MQRAPALFVVPPLDGPVTGGTRFNAELLRALGDAGAPARALDLDEARRVLATGALGRAFVDSLFLPHVPELRRLCGPEAPLGLLVHYLPSLVARALGEDRAPLEAVEGAAIAASDAFVVPSAFMAREVARRAGPERRVIVIEPGCSVRPAAEAPPRAPVAVVVVASLVRGKGALACVRALAGAISTSDDFSLAFIGDERAEPEYAAECRSFVASQPLLRTRAHFEGPLVPAVVESRLGRANLFVSASLTESYGMALAEARAAGVPILAVEGGNAGAHVAEVSGGESFATHAELARALVRLCREPNELERRIEAARAHARSATPPSWLDAARAFQQAFGE